MRRKVGFERIGEPMPRPLPLLRSVMLIGAWRPARAALRRGCCLVPANLDSHRRRWWHWRQGSIAWGTSVQDPRWRHWRGDQQRQRWGCGGCMLQSTRPAKQQERARPAAGWDTPLLRSTGPHHLCNPHSGGGELRACTATRDEQTAIKAHVRTAAVMARLIRSLRIADGAARGRRTERRRRPPLTIDIVSRSSRRTREVDDRARQIYHHRGHSSASIVAG